MCCAPRVRPISRSTATTAFARRICCPISSYDEKPPRKATWVWRLSARLRCGVRAANSDPSQSRTHARVFQGGTNAHKAGYTMRVWGAGVVLLLALGLPLAGKEAGNLALAKGARVGVINLLDAEVTHFHAAKQIKDSFLKTYTVNWPVAAMLSEALKERVGQMGLV